MLHVQSKIYSLPFKNSAAISAPSSSHGDCYCFPCVRAAWGTFSLQFEVNSGNAWFCSSWIRKLLWSMLTRVRWFSHPWAGRLFLTTRQEPWGATAFIDGCHLEVLPPEVNLLDSGECASNFPSCILIKKHCFCLSITNFPVCLPVNKHCVLV